MGLGQRFRLPNGLCIVLYRFVLTPLWEYIEHRSAAESVLRTGQRVIFISSSKINDDIFGQHCAEIREYSAEAWPVAIKIRHFCAINSYFRARSTLDRGIFGRIRGRKWDILGRSHMVIWSIFMVLWAVPGRVTRKQALLGARYNLDLSLSAVSFRYSSMRYTVDGSGSCMVWNFPGKNDTTCSLADW